MATRTGDDLKHIEKLMKATLSERLSTTRYEYKKTVNQCTQLICIKKMIKRIGEAGCVIEAEQLADRLVDILKGQESVHHLARDVMLLSKEVGCAAEDTDGIEGDSTDTEEKASRSYDTCNKSDKKRETLVPSSAQREVSRSSYHVAFQKAVFTSICSWICSLIGLAVTVALLVRSFLQSRNYPIITRSFDENVAFDLPIISICSSMANTPAFHNLPSKQYPGHPLFTVNEVVFSAKEDTIQYPNAMKEFQTQILGPSVNECQTRLRNIDVGVANILGGFGSSVDNDEAPCFECVAIGAKKAIQVSSAQSEGLRSGLSVNVVISRMYSYCFIESARNFNVLQNIFEADLMREIKPLVDKDILNFNGHPVNLNNETDVLRKLVFQSENRENNQGLEAVEFYCNVYFFSGHFYPTSKGKEVDIRYLYNGTTWPQAWIRAPNSKGPYFKVAAQATFDELSSYESSGLKPVDGKKDAFSRLNSISLAVFAEERDGVRAYKNRSVNAESIVSVIDRESVAIIQFRQPRPGSSGSSTTYPFVISKVDNQALPSTEGPYLANRFNFTFEEVQKEGFSTYSFLQLLPDLLEVITLFTGLSFYSVIVVPSTAFIAKRQRRRRLMAARDSIERETIAK